MHETPRVLYWVSSQHIASAWVVSCLRAEVEGVILHVHEVAAPWISCNSCTFTPLSCSSLLLPSLHLHGLCSPAVPWWLLLPFHGNLLHGQWFPG